ncbi:MAG: hypothetical protein QM820_53245 [Minicystis sp.]
MPHGLDGVHTTIALVFVVIARSSASKSIPHSGGRVGTSTGERPSEMIVLR